MLTPEAIASATKAKSELATLESQRLHLEFQRHKVAGKVPPISELAAGFGKIARAIQISDHRNRYEILHEIVRSVGLRRVVVGDSQPIHRNRRTFRMVIEFKTDDIMRFGTEGIDPLMQIRGFSNIVLKATFDVESNNLRQQITFLEQGYSFIAASFETPPPPDPAAATNANPVQRAIRWKGIISETSKTAADLAASEKVSKGLISQHLSLLRLPQIIIEFMKAGRDAAMKKKFSFRELLFLASLPPTEASARFHQRVAGVPLQGLLSLEPPNDRGSRGKIGD